MYSSPEEYGLRYESVTFGVPSGERLHAWFFPAEGATAGTVVHCHGNGGNITGQFEHMRWLPPRGWNLLCFDYRGYGRSQGRPTRAGTIEDTHAAVAYAASRDDVDASRIVLIGSSLGGAVATVVAAQRDSIRGVVLDSAFSNYRQEVEWICKHRWYTWAIAGLLARLGISAGLDPIDYIGAIAPRPVLIIQGTEDDIVDPRMAEALHAAAGEPKELWIVDGLTHTAIFCDMTDEAFPRVTAFLERCVEN